MEKQRVPRGVAVLLTVLPLVVTVGWLVATRWDTPSDRTVTAQATEGWSNGGIRADDVLDPDPDPGHGLRAGDRVTAVDGVPVGWLQSHPGTVHPQVGQMLTYTVLRPVAGVPQSQQPQQSQQSQQQRLDVRVTLSGYPLAQGLARHLAVFPLLATMYAVATFVIVRRPRQQAARALYTMAVLLPVTVTAYPLSPQVIEVVTGHLWPFLVADVGNCLLWGALLHFALVFPDPPPFVTRRPWIVVAAYLLPFGYHAGWLAVFLPQTDDPLTRLQTVVVISQSAAHIQPFLVAGAMVVGYRNASDDLARRGMRWAFVTVAVSTVAYLTLGQLPTRLIGHPLIPWDWQVLLFAPFPVALGLAILRYRLFDIQIIVRRSLVFGALTAGLGGLYLLVVAVSSRLGWLPSRAGPFVASLSVALLFGPLRTQARRVISHSLFGDRDDPYEVMDRLARRLEATASADSVLTTLVETLTETLRLSYAAIRLRGAADRATSYGVPTGSSIIVPIVHAGEQVGELEIDPGARREPFGVSDQRLLDGLARQVGVISQNLLLEMRLRQSLERLVTAREEERRRLRRDLHDGLGPSLATTAMQVDLAASLIERDPARARKILTDLGRAQRDAVAGLRRLVDGLRPPVLDRLGLIGALRDSSEAFTAAARVTGPTEGKPPTVTVDADADVEPLPAAVEVAAYRLTQEALTNVVRHAKARRCEIRLWREAGALLVQIRDDGCGLPTGYRAGVGINAIRERATELGGSASVTAGPDGGTVVFARLPVRPAP